MNPAETDAPAAFADLGLAPAVLAALADVGYESPSPIQAATIPVLLAGHDLLGQAQTGTGKTAAFALPLLSMIDVARREPQVLVLVPTRELAIQVAEAFQKYAAPHARLPRAADLRRAELHAAVERAEARHARHRRHAGPRHGPPRARHAEPRRRCSTSCSTKRTRCCTWVSSTRSSRSSAWRRPSARSRCSRPRCRSRSAASRRSTCASRRKSRSARRPARPPTSASGTGWCRACTSSTR